MLFILTRELWQTVRHCARKAETQSDIWYWTSGDYGRDVVLRTHDEQRTMSAVIARAVEKTQMPVRIVAASPDLSHRFERIVEFLVESPERLRISLMITSGLEGAELEECRNFLRKNRRLRSRVSTLFLATRTDSEFAPLEPETVEGNYRSFLQLLCGGGVPLGEALGIFRSPLDEGEPEEPDEFSSPFATTGILATLGVRSWLPREEEIVALSQELLALLVAAEEKTAAADGRVRAAESSTVLEKALRLDGSGEPLHEMHFAHLIPEPPESPFESWKVPFSTRRAHKERRHLQQRVQADFDAHTGSLDAILHDIDDTVRGRSVAAFSEATQTYRSDIFDNLDVGTISLLFRDYLPGFETKDRPWTDDEVTEASTGWPPDESQDCFCDVYEALEEGLDGLPSPLVWAGSVLMAVAFFAGAWRHWEADGWIPIALSVGGFLAPALLWVYRMVKVRELRARLVDLSEGVFVRLRESFEAEVQWLLEYTRAQLEKDIRADAALLRHRLRAEFNWIPWILTPPPLGDESLQEAINRVKIELLDTGIDEIRLDRLAARLHRLAGEILERGTRDPDAVVRTRSERTLREVMDEWIDELVGSSFLPLEKVAELKDEILDTAGSWRSPAFMAPLTDAELHRGFRKVVVLPDSDIVYQQLQDALPTFSGNPVVSLRACSAPVPGVAVCSVMTGLPDSILDYRANADAVPFVPQGDLNKLHLRKFAAEDAGRIAN